MYTVSIFKGNNKQTAKFETELEATTYANIFWHLFPVVTDPSGKPVLTPGSGTCIDSEY